VISVDTNPYEKLGMEEISKKHARHLSITQESVDKTPESIVQPLEVMVKGSESETNEIKIRNIVENLVLYSKDVDSKSKVFLVEGPTFDAFYVPLHPGASLSTIQRSTQDIARELGVASIEISNDDSRKGYVSILVPRSDRKFPTPPNSIAKCRDGEYLPIYVGQKLNGDDHISSLNTWPHALIAGTTGSGKTSFLRGLINQIAENSQFDSELIVVDGKGESDYFGIAPAKAFHPKYPKPELTMAATADILQWLVHDEIPRRRNIINKLAETNNSRIDAREEYLKAIAKKSSPLFLPIVVIVDEFAELMLERGPSMQNFVDNVSSICQTGRSALVHLILATQRPDRKIVPGRIHANLDTKVALRVPTPADSMTILGYGGAEKLLGSGDMLFSWKGSDNLRLQGYYYA
jgi:S-DNA-T family DNA segregation ATPase FtsK/SpoIIIE